MASGSSVLAGVNFLTERYTEDSNTVNYRAGYPLEGDNSTPADFITISLGNTARDLEAQREVIEQNDEFDISNLSNNVLDVILRMPRGFRTKVDLPFLRGVPLGLLIYKLSRRAVELFGNDSIMGQFVLGGTMVRFKNRVDISSQGRPSIDNPDVPYYPKSISQDVDYFYFRQLPLDRVEYDWPFDRSTQDYIRGTTFRGHPRISLIDYMREFTGTDEGSDMTFFVMGHGAFIYRRFRNFREEGYEGANRRFNTRMIRSGGLRQVLYRSYLGFIGSGYSFYIPSGSDGNCFEASLRWCYIKSTDSSQIGVFNKIWAGIMRELGERIRISGEEYERKYKSNGFPTDQMRDISYSFYWITGYKPELWYSANKTTRWQNLLYRASWRNDGTFKGMPLEREEYGRLAMFQMDDSGLIRDDKRRARDSKACEEEESYFKKAAYNGELGRMMHCVGIHPAPPCFAASVPPMLARGRALIEKAVNEQSKAFFNMMYERKRYWKDITEVDISILVETQRNRYQEKCVSTLIFNPESSKRLKDSNGVLEDGKSKKGDWQLRKWEKEGCKPQYYVVAYDLETVSNLLDLHLSGRVYHPYSRESDITSLSLVDRTMYDPGECQIPFSAQWIVVNSSDRGTYLDRKTVEASNMVHGAGGINTSTFFTPDHDSPNKEFFLSRAHTEKGDNLLGKCVEDMLINIAVYVHARGGKHAYCYAHNGSRFDAFVVLQYQRFEITRILKTSRGVMTVSIRVPIEMTYPTLPGEVYDYRIHDVETPKVNIILRDTMLHVPGSLSRLCKGFNVPKEYCKLEFPIQKVNGFNYTNPAIASLIEAYGENDVKALGVIIVRINDLIGASPWKPANLKSLKPPIAQFVTCMGMIRASTRVHFNKYLPRGLHPQAIDIPALRGWLQMATIGGRVNAYAKTYTSHYAGVIMQAALNKDVERLQRIYKKMLAANSCMQVLDFTSLYPFAMDSCPMPTGRLKTASVPYCWESIEAIGCADCDLQLSLCPRHRGDFNKIDGNVNRPFVIIIVKNVGYMSCHLKRNMCARKSYLASTQKPTLLAYTLEEGEEYRERMKGKEEIRDTQAFTNIDLYWMLRQGFNFEVVGGFEFEVSNVYNLFIGPAFQDRIRAKKEGNKLLSDFLKLNYNGSFGITTQQDITDSFFTARIDDSLKDVDPRTPEVRQAIYRATSEHKGEGLEAVEELTGEAFYLPNGQVIFQKRKKEHLSEFYADQSPMQIGAAVLAWSRHIANLVMFNINEEDQTYTDTDSIAINNALTVNNPRLAAMICNRDDAPLGSLKNDHAENNGTEPRIFFSMIGTKKVKCHMTLNEEGKIRIFNTFKGLNVATQLEGGVKTMHPEYAEYISAKTLLYLNVQSSSPPVEVTSWKRDLQQGVSIGNHLQSLSPDTYLEDCKGTLVKNKPYGTVEFFVPHGCIVEPHFPVYRDETNGYECTQGQARRSKLLTDIWKGIESEQLVQDFIEDYYSEVNKEFVPDSEEYRQILKVFDEIEK